jgi:hypothetical protein
MHQLFCLPTTVLLLPLVLLLQARAVLWCPLPVVQ